MVSPFTRCSYVLTSVFSLLCKQKLTANIAYANSGSEVDLGLSSEDGEDSVGRLAIVLAKINVRVIWQILSIHI